MGTGGQALAWLLSFLEDHPQRVQLGEMLSTLWTLICGVPQRSVISPMPFNIYMRLLREVIRSSGALYHQYVDDTQLYISFHPSAVDAVTSLEHCLDAMLGWIRDSRL